MDNRNKKEYVLSTAYPMVCFAHRAHIFIPQPCLAACFWHAAFFCGGSAICLHTASKGALLALTHSLANSLAHRVRVNAISPGWIDVSGWKKKKNRKFIAITAAEHAQHLVGRVGIPEDVAKAALYLTSDDAGFITGSNFVVDGGMTVKMIYTE